MTTKADRLFDRILDFLRDEDLTPDEADKIVEDAAEMAKDAYREEYDDDTCRTCGGSGGGDPPFRCPACTGSGTNQHARNERRSA